MPAVSGHIRVVYCLRLLKEEEEEEEEEILYLSTVVSSGISIIIN